MFALENDNTPAELKYLSKSECEAASILVKTASEKTSLTKCKLIGPSPNSVTTNTEEPDDFDMIDGQTTTEEYPFLALVTSTGVPVGGWFDKQGKVHVTHVEYANRLNGTMEHN